QRDQRGLRELLHRQDLRPLRGGRSMRTPPAFHHLGAVLVALAAACAPEPELEPEPDIAALTGAALTDEHPEVVALRIDDHIVCSGALIAPDVIVTAAHCPTPHAVIFDDGVAPRE